MPAGMGLEAATMRRISLVWIWRVHHQITQRKISNNREPPATVLLMVPGWSATQKLTHYRLYAMAASRVDLSRRAGRAIPAAQFTLEVNFHIDVVISLNPPFV